MSWPPDGGQAMQQRVGVHSPVRLVAHLWWTATRRRWQEEFFPGLILLGVVAVHGHAILTGPPGSEALYLSALYGLTLTTALFLPMMFRGSSVLATVRFDLLPYTPDYFFLLRLLFAHPLRVLLAASAAGWTLVGILRLPLGGAHTVAAVLQLLGWTLAAALTVQVVEDAVLRRRAIVVHTLLSMIGLVAGSLLLSYRSLYNDLAPALEAVSGSALLLGSRAALPPETAATVLALALGGAAIIGGRRAAVGHARPVPPPLQLPLLTGLIAATGALAAPLAPSAFGKELASILRHFRIGIGVLWAFLVGVMAFATGNPFLLVLAPLFWATTWMYNLLGMDVPLAGLTRYRLLPRPIGRVLLLRHAAMSLAVTVAVVAGVLAVALFGGWSTPTAGPSGMLMYTIAYLYGVSVFLLGAVFGNRLSVRYPNWLDLVYRKTEGVQTPTLVGLVAMIGWAVLAIAIFFGASIIARILVEAATGAARTGLILVIATLVQLSLYALSIRSRYRRAGTSA